MEEIKIVEKVKKNLNKLVILVLSFLIFLDIITVGVWYFIFKKILDYINKLEKVRQHIRNMYNGNTESILNEDELYGELKQALFRQLHKEFYLIHLCKYLLHLFCVLLF